MLEPMIPHSQHRIPVLQTHPQLKAHKTSLLTHLRFLSSHFKTQNNTSKHQHPHLPYFKDLKELNPHLIFFLYLFFFLGVRSTYEFQVRREIERKTQENEERKEEKQLKLFLIFLEKNFKQREKRETGLSLCLWEGVREEIENEGEKEKPQMRRGERNEGRN